MKLVVATQEKFPQAGFTQLHLDTQTIGFVCLFVCVVCVVCVLRCLFVLFVCGLFVLFVCLFVSHYCICLII